MLQVKLFHLRLFPQGGLLSYLRLFLIAGEGIVHQTLVRLWGKEAGQRHNDQPGHHGCHAAVDGRLDDLRDGRKKMLATISTELNRKQIQQAAFVTLLE